MVLKRFLAISIALHLCLLMEFRHLFLSTPNRHLGQPVLEIQFQGEALSPAPNPFFKTATGSPITKKSSSYPITPTETIASSSPFVSVDEIGLRSSVSTTETEGGLRNQLLGELRTRLSHYLTYPPQARNLGWEGTVLLSLRVEPDGQLDRIRLERSSGYAVLDNSALNSLKRIGNLVEARTWLEGHSVDMQLPVIYRLIEN